MLAQVFCARFPLADLRRFFSQIILAIGVAQRRRWALLIAFAVVVSVVEACAALVVGLLLTVFADPAQDLDAPLLEQVGGLVGGSGSQFSVVAVVGAVAAGFFVLRAGLVLLQVYVQGRVSHNTGAALSARLLDSYLALPYSDLVARDSSELIRNGYNTAFEVVVYVLVPLIQGVSEVLVMVALIAVLLIAAPLPAVAAALTLGLVIFLIQRGLRPRLQEHGEDAPRFHGKTLESLQEAISGAREIKVLGVEQHFLRGFASQRRGLARSSYMRGTLVEVPRVTVETALVLIVVVLLLLTTSNEGSPREALAVIGLFAYAGFRTVPSVNRVVAAVNNCRFGRPSLEILAADLEAAEAATQRHRDRVTVAGPIESIGLVDATFRYPGANSAALTGCTFEVKAGEAIGVAGGTGSGKSTLVHVMAGLLTPTSGSVVVNGTKLPARHWGWQGQFGLVTQEVFLINDTVKRNIAFGVGDDVIDEERLAEAVELAQLSDVISTMPAGINSVVGDLGHRLSGGQRQRISLARALYRRPDVLVLDEGTSALDTTTEDNVIRLLRGTRGPRTLIHVAHRLTSLRLCDRILVLDQGAIVDQGSFTELATRHPAFKTSVEG